jgi:hypothetical protein
MSVAAAQKTYPNMKGPAMEKKPLSRSQVAIYGLFGGAIYLALQALDSGNYFPVVAVAVAAAVIHTVIFLRRKAVS